MASELTLERLAELEERIVVFRQQLMPLAYSMMRHLNRLASENDYAMELTEAFQAAVARWEEDEPIAEAGKAQAEGWTRVDDKLPVYLDGWWWVQFSSGEISTVPYIRALNQWLFEGKSRDHGTIVAYCRAAAPPMGEVFHPGPLPSPPSEPSQLPAGEAGR